MPPLLLDRDTFLQHVRLSKLLTNEQYRVVVERLRNVHDAREIAKALATWKLITKFQAKMLLKGRTTGFFLGPYRILDELGKGGMGRVYKAVHQTMNRVVALKILSQQVVNSERAQQLFAREVQAAAQLAHPNIVMAYDANELDGRHYLAMEYVDGSNLESYVKQRGPLPVGLACEIAFQAANGLQHAFEKQMVHRDIKPANLLLQQDVKTDTIQIKILDFGLARLAHAEKSAMDQTILIKERTVMGTPDFLSPEQSRDLHDVDVRSDLYSLGCTFYYLLTGHVPFPGGSIVEKVVRHNNDVAKPIEELRPDVPPKVAAIARKLMMKEPVERYQTPDELMDALAPYAAPAATDWPIAPVKPAAEKSNIDLTPLSEVHVDTEPRAQSSTQISDEDSVLDWVDTNRKQRRFVRVILFGVGALLGVGVLAAAAGVWWCLQ